MGGYGKTVRVISVRIRVNGYSLGLDEAGVRHKDFRGSGLVYGKEGAKVVHCCCSAAEVEVPKCSREGGKI